MATNYAAERFPPGDTIREEIEARGWTQSDLADITGINRNGLNQIINGKRQITPETAAALGEAFGTGAQFWLNLETAYQLWKRRPCVADVARRARLYEFAPMKELMARGWVEPSEDVSVLEQRVCDFFEVKSLDEEPTINAAARMTDKKRTTLTRSQLAWLFRVKRLSRAIDVSPYSREGLKDTFDQLRQLLKSETELRHIPLLLAKAGIRMVIAERLPGTSIDGACLWLDKKSPIVGLTFRYDRIDWFWHTLMHELKHVANDEGAVDIKLVGKGAQETEQKPRHEVEADLFASSFLVPKDELDDFITRTAPLYSKRKIRNFAARLQVHVGIIVGQLQFRGEIPYSHSRETLVPVRKLIADSALTDGWGSIIGPTA